MFLFVCAEHCVHEHSRNVNYPLDSDVHGVTFANAQVKADRWLTVRIGQVAQFPFAVGEDKGCNVGESVVTLVP